jgi:hypothetical protein
MPALLLRPRPRWTWPLAWSLAALVVALALAIPESWWWLLVPDRPILVTRAAGPAPALRLLELEVITPPPVIEAAPERPQDRPRPEPPLDPDWWTRGWNARIVGDLPATGPALPDSLLPRPLLELLGARAALDLVLSQPDSVVQAQLWWLVEEERLARDDLDGLFTAVARARSYADKMSREAAMYDEFLLETVPVPR